MYVLIYHAFCEVRGSPLSAGARQLTSWMGYGHYSVGVFIVLSGYCLMLPVARSGNGRLRGGFASYLWRRARRILPPYYAALGVSLILIACIPALRRPTGAQWDKAIPVFTTGVLASHVFLVHNLRPDWLYRINPPFWSVATEWQIYWVFPVLLLPMWRRVGTTVTIVSAFAIGFFPHFVFQGRLDQAALWFLGLFAMGMAGAALEFSQDPVARWCRQRVPWGVLTIIAFGFVVIGLQVKDRAGLEKVRCMNVLVGTAVTLLLIYCTREYASKRNARRLSVCRFLALSPFVRLGTFSYSLYLMHFPVLSILNAVIPSGVSPELRLAFLVVIGAPVSIMVAYGFFRLFEKPFVTARIDDSASIVEKPSRSGERNNLRAPVQHLGSCA